MRQIKVKTKKVVMPSRMQRKPADRHVNMQLQGWSNDNKPVYRPELNDSPTTQEGDEKEEPQTKPTNITTSKLQELRRLTTDLLTARYPTRILERAKYLQEEYHASMRERAPYRTT